MTNPAQALYEAHHEEFEAWILQLQPNRDAPEWVQVHDCGWYSDDWFQGAWIVWLELNNKRNTPEKGLLK